MPTKKGNELVSLILCTVRDSNGYRDRPEWDTIGKVVEDLSRQEPETRFELIIVDGLLEYGARRDWSGQAPFPIVHVGPRQSFFVSRKKVAISAYRNTGIAHARGELIINLDDCCVLPPNFVSTYWDAWQRGVCLAMTWPRRGDCRRTGHIHETGERVYGFGSYPLEVALRLNGYDEAYDGGQGLEDIDWSTRLGMARVDMFLAKLDGFDIEPQTAHSSIAIGPDPIVKCCNAAWQCQRVLRTVKVANVKELWTPEWLRKLVGPCIHLKDGRCGHHGFNEACAYLSNGFADADPNGLFYSLVENPPVIDLAMMHRENCT